MKTINAIYSEDANDAIADAKALEWYQNFLSNTEQSTIYFATSVQFNMLRLGVRLGEIKPFSFVYKQNTINILQDGQLDNWYDLFHELLYQMDALMKGTTYQEQVELNEPKI